MYEQLAQDFKTGTDAATKRMLNLLSEIGDAIVNAIRSVIGDGGANEAATNFLALPIR